MIGIKNIGIYIPDRRSSNLEKLERHQTDESFVINKIGIKSVSVKEKQERSSDLCLKAFEDLKKMMNVDLSEIDFVMVCTQNPDYVLPQTSAIVHEKLGLGDHVAAFDISLGCSGYVYGIHTAKAFMEQNNLKHGLFFTSDQYSDIIDPNDKNTDLLFGDAATVTYLSEDYVFSIGKGVFTTAGKKHQTLIKRENEALFMNGREIFNFVVKYVPLSVKECLEKNSMSLNDVDAFLLHQASKYVVDALATFMKVDPVKVPFTSLDYGNTVSSTIPIMLKDYLFKTQYKNILISGFGVGLSSGTSIIRRK